MAAVSEQARVNFNPEWMRSTSTYSANNAKTANLATSPPFGSPNSNNNTNVSNSTYCGSAANNADGQVLAPAKLAKNRYGREEMLAFFAGNATVAPPELKTTFPDFYVEAAQEPMCMLPLTDAEERSLIQGGINSSKVINVINHAERAMRWPHANPQRAFGRGGGGVGFGGGGEALPGGGDNSPDTGGTGFPQYPVGPGGFTRLGGPPGMGRGTGRGLATQMSGGGGFDQFQRPPARFPGGLGRGRGRGGFDRYPGGGGFGEPGQGAGGGNGSGQNSADGESFVPQNTRAQGLYDPNDPRDRPRQRQKSTSRPEEYEDAAGGARPANVGPHRRSYAATSIGQQSVPEWAMDDEETLAEDALLGTFDASGQFQEINAHSEGLSECGKESITETSGKPPAAEAPKKVSPTATTVSDVDPPKKDPSHHNVQGRSIPVETLFSAANNPPMATPQMATQIAPTQQKSQAPLSGTGHTHETFATAAAYSQNRRLPKAFASLGLQDQQQQQQNVGGNPASYIPPFSMAPNGENQKQQLHHSQVAAGHGQGQPKFVVPKSISSSPDSAGVLSKLHEHAENLVNSFSADDTPSVMRSHKGNTAMIASNLQQHPPQHQQQAYGGMGGYTTATTTAATGPNPAPVQPNYESHGLMNATRSQVMNQRWFYRDPQGDLRGPFESTQMATWFAAGYFTMDLMLRRVEDTDFVPLGNLIKKFGRIPFMPSTSDTPSPNPLSSANLSSSGSTLPGSVTAATDSSSSPVLIQQPTTRYGGVVTSAGQSQTGRMMINDPSNIHHGALANHTGIAGAGGGGAFQKIGPQQHVGGGLWDLDLPPATTAVITGGTPMQKASADANQSGVDLDLQTHLSALNQMLQKEREEELRRLAEEEERQRKMQEAQEATRREQVRQRALLKEKEEELKRLQDARLEAERRRKQAEEEEEAKRLQQKQLEEQQRRLEELTKKEAEEKRKKQQEEEQRRKKEAEEKRRRQQEAEAEAEEERRREREAREEYERHEEQAMKAAAAAAKARQQQEEQRKQQAAKKSAAPWTATAQQQHTKKDGAQAASGAARSLADIQKEEERQMRSEMRQKMEQEMQRKKDIDTTSIQFGSAWGGSAAASTKLKWDPNVKSQSNSKSGGPAWGGKGEVVNSAAYGNIGLWEDEESPLASPKKTKSTKPSNQSSAPVKKSQSEATSKKDENVKKIFQQHQSANDDFTTWCLKQLKSFNAEIDGVTFIAFLKEVESASEVEEYVVSYLGESRASRDFMKAFLEKRNGQRKATAVTKVPADDLLTPAPALNPMKSTGGGENVSRNVSDKSAGAGKKKKSNKSAGRFVVDGSILGFKAAADPNRLNAGEIDSPM